MSIQPVPISPQVLPAASYQMGDPAINLADSKAGLQAAENYGESAELREAFHDFVGQTFFSQMLSAMRKTVDKPAYFHGGRTEEIFQNQLDQQLAEQLSDSTATSFIDPMFDIFTLQRQ